MEMLPLLDRYAMRLPSGDQTGWWLFLSLPENVNRVDDPRSKSVIQRSPFETWCVTAKRPSGDNATPSPPIGGGSWRNKVPARSNQPKFLLPRTPDW